MFGAYWKGKYESQEKLVEALRDEISHLRRLLYAPDQKASQKADTALSEANVVLGGAAQEQVQLEMTPDERKEWLEAQHEANNLLTGQY